MKAGDIVRFRAQDYANSETVGAVDDHTLFVPQLIVGEEALVRVSYVKRNVAYASVVEVTKPSQARISPPCAIFGRCGGCALMHMSYDEQLKFKQNKVANNLAKLGKLSLEVLPCVPSPLQMGYRNKLSLPVGSRRGNVRVCMFERNSHRKVPCAACSLGGDWSGELVLLFERFCNEANIQPYDEVSFCGDVRHLVGRFVDGQLLVTVVTNGEPNIDWRPIERMLKERFGRFGLFVNVNTARNNVILGGTTRHICGIEQIESQHLGVRFRLRPNSFFQVNDGVKDLIYCKVKELLDTSRTQVLVDCFSGIGLLTNVLASRQFDTYAIEIQPSAVSDANEMVQLNNTPRVHNICGDVTTELPKIVAQNVGKRFTVVVDPPRKGLNETICGTLKQASPQNIVYISCDSATLARDLNVLSDSYRVAYVQPFDMFPQTDQVETLCLLTKLENK